METREWLGRLEERMDRMDHILHGNGQPGLVSEMRTFFGRMDERESAAKKTDKDRMWKVAIVAVALPILYDVAKHVMGFWK